MNLVGYVVRDLLRNPRRTLASLVGVLVGVGLFSAVLFFIDGSGASMTKRAVAPLTLDVQRVLTAPLGGGISFDQKVADSALDAGGTTTVTLAIANGGLTPANEVVVRDQLKAPLAYVPGSTSRDGKPVADVGGKMPLFQGYSGVGLNIGTVAPNTSQRITYRVTATKAVPSTSDLPAHATISAREAVTPTPANEPTALPLMTLADKVGRIQGIRAADPLVFVDMAGGAISANGVSVPGPVKLFSFDAKYQAHYPSIKVVAGGFREGGVLVSAETARALKVGQGDTVAIGLPGTAKPLSMTVSGVTDLSSAKPLFESREAKTLEKFVYVPFTVVVDEGVYRKEVEPAFKAAAASRTSVLTNFPLEELDILLDRSALNADPATAVAQTQLLAENVSRVAAHQDYLIDNISNTLLVAKGDARIAKRMFVFLGLPGAILAAILTAYAGTLLAEAQRRENALLRVRGASQRHLLFLLALRTLAIAGLGAVLGTALGLGTVLALLGRTVVFEASNSALIQSALVGVVGGMLVTAIALYVPGRRLITQEIKEELAAISRHSTPIWRRFHLDFVALAGAGVAQVMALRAGAFNIPAGSVYAGQSVSLPLQLLIAPIVAWLAGSLLIGRILQGITARAASTRPSKQETAPHFGGLLPGVLWRSITRRLGAVTGGAVTLGLVVALGTMLACFATVYDNAKTADARFLVGSDIRVTPNPTSPAKHPTTMTKELGVAGTTAAAAVVFGDQNSVLTSKFNEDVASLAAIDPRTYSRVGALQDSLFAQSTASAMMSKLQNSPHGILVNSALAEGLKLRVGADATVLLGRGTDQQKRTPTKVVGLFTQFPGAPKGTDIVANLGLYQNVTGLTEADYFLLSTAHRDKAGLQRATASLSSIKGFDKRFDVQTSSTALNRDQSSLTALNVKGLLHLNTFFTFVMAVSATAMFVFGLLLQRRREYVTMRAQGMRSGEIRRLLLAESSISAVIGAAIGLVVGIGMASQFVQVLRPIFTLTPRLQVPTFELTILAVLVLGASALSSAAGAMLIGRLKPTELLRDE